MNVAKQILWICVFLVSITTVFAAPDCIKNEECVLWADIVNQSVYYGADQADITLFTPNSSVYLENQSMQNIATGIFRYNYTTNITGNWYGNVRYYQNGSLIALATISWHVGEASILSGITGESIVVLLAVAIIIFALLYIWKLLDNDHKLLRLWIFIMVLGLLVVASSTTLLTSLGIATTLHVAIMWGTRVVFLYIFIYFTYEVLKWFRVIASERK